MSTNTDDVKLNIEGDFLKQTKLKQLLLIQFDDISPH